MDEKHTFIIAEAGVNHNGELQLAKELVCIAKRAGADAVKFQTFIAESIVSKFAEKAEYQKRADGNEESQYDMIKRLELSYDNFMDLKKFCEEVGIIFLSTPFDNDSIEFLDDLGMQIFKIPSGEITNVPYLVKIAKKNKPVIMSTGMSNIEEIQFAVNILYKYGCDDLTLLHCNTDYPTQLRDANVRAMLTLQKVFNVKVGYSDHTMGIEASLAAVALGAKVIEKHFTISRKMNGPDHAASLEPDELYTMIESIRNLEIALGSGNKIASESELKNINAARKSIVAKHAIYKGEILSEQNLAVKRPGTGISPIKWFDVIGHAAIRDFDEDELIEL